LRSALSASILRKVRHATDRDLDALHELLAALRNISSLRERKRGSFSRGAHAFLHFHADGDDFYADVKLRDAFERLRVTTDRERLEFLAQVKRAIECRAP
jgi:hypothetical protein